MKRTLRIATLTISVLFVLAVVLVVAMVWLQKNVWPFAVMGSLGQTTGSEIVYLQLQDTHFAIPKNYLSDRENWRGGKQDGISLSVLLPDMEPMTEENKEIFEMSGRGDGRKVGIVISESHEELNKEYDKARFERFFQKVINKQTPENTEYELKRYKRFSSKNWPEDDFFVANDLYFLLCQASEVARYPSCKSFNSYNDKLRINYFYSKAQLHNWKTIHKKILNLVKSFENIDEALK